MILLGLAGRSRESNVILDYGSGNHRRYVAVSNIAAILDEKQAGMTESLLGMHALTGCDFTSCFFRKGKLNPFQRLVADISDRHATALRSLSSVEVDMPGVTSFVCSMYGFTTSDITAARYKAFIRMSGCDEKDPLATIKKINSASLPGRSVPETLEASRRDDATTRMDDAASHIGDVATHADEHTNRTDDPHDDVDDTEMVETTSTDDEFESAWREDSDDSADKDPSSNIRGR